MKNANNILDDIPALKVFKTQRQPTWVWDVDQGVILWANIAGLAFWDEPDLLRLRQRKFDHSMPALQRLFALANHPFPKNGIEDTFLFWTHKGVRKLRCSCTPLKLQNGFHGLILSEITPEEGIQHHANGLVASPEPFNEHSSSNQPYPSYMHLPTRPASTEDQTALNEIAHLIRNPEVLINDYQENDYEDSIMKALQDKTQTQKLPSMNGAASDFTSHFVPPNASSDESQAPDPQFLAKVSHELRTPLNSILGFSEMIKTEQFGPLKNDKYKDYIESIYDSAHHALKLVNDFLNISKIEAGQFSTEPERLELHPIVEQSIRTLNPQASKKRLIVRQSLSTTPIWVRFDKSNLTQILLNILSNAIKFTDTGGQVIVSTTRHKTGAVHLRISDTGIGMSRSDITQALQPFQQLDIAPDQYENGTGLGLPLTKALIDANRAEFRIESQPSKGTLVEITFPKEIVIFN